MQVHSKENFLSKYGLGVLFGIWTISTIIYVSVFGLNSSLEAVKYIGAARELLQNGRLPETRYWFYFLTIAFIGGSLFFKCGLTGAFLLQAAYNLFAYYFFYRALKKLFDSCLTPVLIIVYLLLFWPYQSWITFLYTESAFYSSVLLLFSCIVLYPATNLRNLIKTAAALLLTIISRPLGILFIGNTGLYLLNKMPKKQRIAAGILILFAAIAAVRIVDTIFSTISDWTIMKPFVEENIICDLPSQKSDTALQLARSGSPLYQLLYYCVHNPAHFFHFAFIKLKYFFGATRSYYSTAHNAFLLMNMLPIYLLAIGATIKVKMKSNIKPFIWITIGLFTLAIALQCDDWHNRFILAIYPFFVILAAYGLEGLLRFFKHKDTSVQ
ncbi:MAG: hypothetical protein QM640_17615 [Niabella sp.]